MKKLFLFLLVLAVFSVSASAQASRYTSVIAKDVSFNIDNGYNCPVANFNLSYSVAAIKKDATITAFCLIDHDFFCHPPLPVIPVITPTVHTDVVFDNFSSIATDFTVNDIFIANQYIFFCGSINSSSSFYGYFDINDFWGTTGMLNVTIHQLQPVNTSAPSTLKKLVAYKEDGKFKVVAIGDEDINPYNGTCKIVEIFNAVGTPSCKVADMPFYTSPFYQKVFLDDILLLDDYVVVLGHETNIVSPPSSGFTWFSMGRRNHVVADISDPILNPNYYLQSPYETIGGVIGTPIDKDTFAMAYVNWDNSYPAYFTRIRTIDAASLQNVYAQQYKVPDAYDPEDMVYNRGVKKLEIMQPYNDSSDFIYINPQASSSYNTSMLRPDGRKFKSIKNILSTPLSKSFIATRNATVYLQYIPAALPHSTITCPVDYNLSVKPIERLDIKSPQCKIHSGENELDVYNCQFQLLQNDLQTQCFSYE